MFTKRVLIGLTCVVLLTAGEGGCDDQQPASASAQEQTLVNNSYEQLLRNQPPPVFDYSLERRMLIETYKARQRATNTYSVVQSEFTGKVLWSCPSIGFPLPYATQLTNPDQVKRATSQGIALAVIPQPEQNGLFPPAAAEATWVPCVDTKGHITPVYEERKVTVFLQPMEEHDGALVPQAGSKPSFTIDPTGR
jgi:hypothetical protein